MSDIIVCSASTEILGDLKEKLPGLYGSLSFASSSDELKTKAAGRSSTTILIFDYEFLIGLDDATVFELEKQFLAPFILVSSKELNFNVAQLKRSERISHVVGHRPESIAEDLNRVLTQILRQRDQDKVRGGDIREIFNVDNTKVTSFFLDDSEERWDCYKELSNYVSKLAVFTGFTDIATTVASELITNAFFNGPRSNDGLDKALYPSRQNEVRLIPPKKVEFCYWSDSDYFWVMVTDPFGSLKKSKLISSLHRAVTQRAPVVDGDGGAGLGLSMIADWCSELYFGLEESHSTWIACRIQITRRRKVFFSQRSNLHIYEIAQPVLNSEDKNGR